MITVIVVNYNAGALLTECVEPALASACPVKVIVSDNGSVDDSIPFLRHKLGDNPNLIIIENRANLGFAKANNVALCHAEGEYVLFLNPDCIIQPDTLQQMRDVMDAHPDAGMAGCLILNLDGSEQVGCRRFVPTPWRSLMRVLKLSKCVPNNPRFGDFNLHGMPLPDGPVAVEALSGAFMFVRRSAMDQVGTLDEGYFLHCEDLDWCMRFRRASYKILFVPSVQVSHVKGVSSSGRHIFVEWHKHRGMIRFYRKFFRHQYPGILMAAVFVMVWVRFFTKVVFLTLKRIGK